MHSRIQVSGSPQDSATRHNRRMPRAGRAIFDRITHVQPSVFRRQKGP